MDNKPSTCMNDCEKCPFASCNFNPWFRIYMVERWRQEQHEAPDEYAYAEAEESLVYRLATRYRPPSDD